MLYRGKGDEGLLGHGTKEHCCIPKQVDTIADTIAEISTGFNHCAAITTKGEVDIYSTLKNFLKFCFYCSYMLGERKILTNTAISL